MVIYLWQFVLMQVILLLIAPISIGLASLTDGISLFLPYVAYAIWVKKMESDLDSTSDL